MKPKIGIMTYYAVHNFGAALQAFALQQNIKRLGADAELIRFFDKHNESSGTSKRGNKLTLLLKNKQLRSNLIFHFPRYIRVKRYTKPNSLGFASFSREHLHSSIEPYYDLEDLKSANSRYCGFVAGSDMVWTPIGQNLEAYFLQFAEQSKRLSYAPSMTGCHTYCKEDATKITEYLNGMSMLSCREKEGVDYVKQTTGRDATLVVDPTLLFSKEDWRKELGITSQKPSKPYILCYNFGGLPRKIEKEVYRIAHENNMDVRYVPLSNKESDAELGLGHRGPYGPREFVELFLNASFCVTNTFHGFLFSLISENPFVVVHREKGNAWKANETRISNLMDILGLTDRFIDIDAQIDKHYLSLDYTKINEIVSSKRKASLDYLKQVVGTASLNQVREDTTKPSNVRDLTNKQCAGCGLCAAVCSFNAITYEEDAEGFLTPKVNKEKCKECGKCAKNCPSIYPLLKNFPIKTKLCLSKDKLVENSASGGVFITIARYYIEQLKGVVYGVVMDADFTCHHAEATTVEELLPMQNSKYVQSIVGDCYAKARQRLEEGRNVLFTGTPCQIAALKSYLNKEYENLLTLDIVCHGVPNQHFWKKYIKEESNDKKITAYTFRTRSNRKIGKTTLEATVSYDNMQKQRPFALSAYYGPFIRNESYRMSCYYCQYATQKRVSDITMGDCDSEKNYPDFYPYESKSIVLLNTDQGVSLWTRIQDRFESTSLDYEKEYIVNIPLNHPSTRPSRRDCIYQDLYNLPWWVFNIKYTDHITLRQILGQIKSKLIRTLNNG